MLVPRKLGHVCMLHTRRASSWQLFGATIVERAAVLVREHNPMEKAYTQMLHDIEAENSLLSDHEMKILAEKKAKAEAVKKGAGTLQVKTTEDIEAEWKAELHEFTKKYSRGASDGDVSAKTTDANRLLDAPVMLLAKLKIGTDNHWMFPQTIHKDTESMRETAERAVLETCGQLKLQSLGNSPCAFYKYKFPKEIQIKTSKEGAKVFLFKALYKGGELKINENVCSEAMWASFDETYQRLPKAYLKAVRDSFYDVPKIDFRRFLENVSNKEEMKKLKLIN